MGNKWIVMTSVRSPTEAVKILAADPFWNLVVVADVQTPKDWKLDGVHFLSVRYQNELPFFLVKYLPYKSYTRKNIGYLYAIAHGAEWIYDTDDDYKPYDKMGLNQFSYEDTISGVRYRPKDGNSLNIWDRLFNPYRFHGIDQMWPRGFPPESFTEHPIESGSQVLCYQMKRASVQQGLVHPDSNVNAIYKGRPAHLHNGLNVKLNKFTPPVTLSVGTYSPWYSQNTLFHKSAFHTLFLPTTVPFQTSDIWRSFISQKILHLSGLTVSFVPVNALQDRNIRNSNMNDFEKKESNYEDSGKFLEFLHVWKCSNRSTKYSENSEFSENLENCIKYLLVDLARNQFWRKKDSRQMEIFLLDLKMMEFKFPSMISDNEDNYDQSTNESSRHVNCRKMHLEFDLIDPQKKRESFNVRKANEKLNYFSDIVQWCNETEEYISLTFPTPMQLAQLHDNSYVLQKDRNSALIVVNNYPWKYGMGLIQRLYQPYFATLIFCGSWNPDQFTVDKHTSITGPVSFIHLNPSEIQQGYFAYHCVTLVMEMRLNNIEGYFMMADDAVFNIWNAIDYSSVHHITGAILDNEHEWWYSDNGLPAAKNIYYTMENSSDPKRITAWHQFERGLRRNGYIETHFDLYYEIASGKGRSFSDFFYIPTSERDYYATLMRVFYENEFFLELAVNKFLKSVYHQTSLSWGTSYLWSNETRGRWHEIYNARVLAMHPVKLSYFRHPGKERKNYCATVIKTWANIIFGVSENL